MWFFFKALGRFVWYRDIEDKSTETNAVGNSVCIMNTISAMKVTLPGSGRETVYDPSASLSLPTLHRLYHPCHVLVQIQNTVRKLRKQN